MPASSDPHAVPWGFVIALIVIGVVVAVVLGYYGAMGHLGGPIPGTHSP
jgi:hypothetical protein